MPTKKDLVKEFLRKHPEKTVEEVARSLGVSVATVRKAMKELEEEMMMIPGQDEVEKRVEELKEMEGEKEEEFLEEEEEEEEIDPEIKEFLDFLLTYVPMTKRKFNYVKKLLSQEGPSILRKPADLEEILTTVANIPQKKVRFVLKRYYQKKTEELQETQQPLPPPPPVTEEPLPAPPPQYQQTQGQYVEPYHAPQYSYGYGYPPQDPLKMKMAEMLDRLSAAMMARVLGDMAAGRPTNYAISVDETGRPVIRPAGVQTGGVTMDEVRRVVEDAVKNVMSVVNDRLKQVVDFVKDTVNSIKQTQSNENQKMMVEMMKMMVEMMKNQNQPHGVVESVLDRMTRMMELMAKRGEDVTPWKEVLMFMKDAMRRKEADPMEMLDKAINIIERKIYHKEKTTEHDIEMAKVEAEKDIARKKLELEEKKLELQAQKDLETTKLLKDLIESLGRDIAVNLMEKVPDVVQGFISGLKKKRETGEMPKDIFKEVPTEELIKAKEVVGELEEAEKGGLIEELIKEVDKELERRSKKSES